MNVDLREYRVEEITVKIIKARRLITITANHKSQFESRSTYREFTLPAGTPDSRPDAIDVVLNANGILTISGPCTPQTLSVTDITEDVKNKVVKQQQQDTSVQQQQQNTSVQQQQRNTSVQQLHDTSVQSEQQIVQKSSFTKITRETFTSSTMTSLDITDATDGDDEPIISAPDTPIEDVTLDMVVDEDGNYITEVNIKDYRAEEITVKASKSTITIIGRKNEENREFVKTIRVPIDVVVTPDKIRSILDKSKKVLTIIITRKTSVNTTTTTEQQNTDNTTEQQTNEQKRIDSQQQKSQQVQQKRETVQDTQTELQQVNRQKQVQQKQESIEETRTQQQVQTQQQINQQKLVQQKRETVQTQSNTQQQINQQKDVQQNEESLGKMHQKDQMHQNTTNTTTTSKRSIKTTKTTIESLQQLGYNFDSATSQVYTGDPKYFERATTVVDYNPDELEVKIAMPWVIIEGKQEMSAENGWRSKQFTKMFTVPTGVKEENIQLEFNDVGDVVNCTARIG